MSNNAELGLGNDPEIFSEGDEFSQEEVELPYTLAISHNTIPLLWIFLFTEQDFANIIAHEENRAEGQHVMITSLATATQNLEGSKAFLSALFKEMGDINAHVDLMLNAMSEAEYSHVFCRLTEIFQLGNGIVDLALELHEVKTAYSSDINTFTSKVRRSSLERCVIVSHLGCVKDVQGRPMLSQAAMYQEALEFEQYYFPLDEGLYGFNTNPVYPLTWAESSELCDKIHQAVPTGVSQPPRFSEFSKRLDKCRLERDKAHVATKSEAQVEENDTQTLGKRKVASELESGGEEVKRSNHEKNEASSALACGTIFASTGNVSTHTSEEKTNNHSDSHLSLSSRKKTLS